MWTNRIKIVTPMLEIKNSDTNKKMMITMKTKKTIVRCRLYKNLTLYCLITTHKSQQCLQQLQVMMTMPTMKITWKQWMSYTRYHTVLWRCTRYNSISRWQQRLQICQFKHSNNCYCYAQRYTRCLTNLSRIKPEYIRQTNLWLSEHIIILSLRHLDKGFNGSQDKGFKPYDGIQMYDNLRCLDISLITIYKQSIVWFERYS